MQDKEVKPTIIKKIFGGFLTKLRNTSLFATYFFSFWLICFCSIALVTVISFQNLRKAERKFFDIRAFRSQQNILESVTAYNEILSSLYTDIDKDQYSKVMQKLQLLGQDYNKIDPKDVYTIAKEENVDIALIDKDSTNIVISSNKVDINIYLTDKYPKYVKYIKALNPGIPNFHYTWTPSTKSFQLIARKLTPDQKFIWSIGLKQIRQTYYSDLIGYFKNINKYDPVVNRIALYSKSKQARHHLKKLKLPPQESFELKTQENISPLNTIWIQLKTIPHVDKNQAIKYIGIEFDETFLNERLTGIFRNSYEVLVLSFIISCILSFTFSSWLSRKNHKLIEDISFLTKNPNSKRRDDEIWIKEFKSLYREFCSILKKLSLKKEETKKLASDILFVADRERSYISRDLHDTVGQLLNAAQLKIASEHFKEAQQVIKTASEELRKIYEDLEPRSIEETNLQHCVECYLPKFFDKDFATFVDLELAKNLSIDTQIQIFRIIQEATANVAKHSSFSEYLEIKLTRISTKFTLRIANDIKRENQMIEKKNGRGLQNIRLRSEALGGLLSVKETKDRFEITVTFDTITF